MEEAILIRVNYGQIMMYQAQLKVLPTSYEVDSIIMSMSILQLRKLGHRS